MLSLFRSQAGYSLDAAITTCYLGLIPFGVDDEAFAFLDAVVRARRCFRALGAHNIRIDSGRSAVG